MSYKAFDDYGDVVIRLLGFTFMYFEYERYTYFSLHYRDRLLFTFKKMYEWEWILHIHSSDERWLNL